MTDINFEKFEQLSEEEQLAIKKTWGEREWCDYFEKDGYVSCEEFFQKLKKATFKIARKNCKEELCNDAADALITALSDYEVCVNHTKDNFDIVKTDIQERLNRKREELGWFPNQRICLTAIACDSKIGNSTLWEWAKRMDKIDKDDKLDQFLALFQKEFRKTFGRSIWISVPAEQSENQSAEKNTNTSEQVMKHDPKKVQKAFLEHLDGREPYYYWKEIPPSKVWYDEDDNCFHTSDGIMMKFEGYELDEMRFCLWDLYKKIIAEYKNRGIIIHDEILD